MLLGAVMVSMNYFSSVTAQELELTGPGYETDYLFYTETILSTGTNNENSSTSIILYENTFDNGLASTVNVDNEYVTVIHRGNRINSSFHGNPGIGMHLGAWPVLENPAIHVTLKEPVSTGTLRISFDTSRLEREGNLQQSYIRLNDRNFVFYMHETRGFFGPLNHLTGWGDWQDSSNTTPFEPEELYHVELIYDLTYRRTYTYVNSVLLTERIIPPGFEISSIGFSLSMINAYFDNLKISVEYPYPVECIMSTDNVGNIFFEDELIMLDINMINRADAPLSANFNFEITDLDGNVVWTDSLSEHFDIGQRKDIRLEVDLPRFGLYVATLYSDLGGEFRLEFSRSVRAGVPNSRAGINGHFHRLSYGNPRDLMELVEAAGFSATRSHWGWNEDADGFYSFSERNQRHAAYIEESIARDIDILAIISLTSPLLPTRASVLDVSEEGLIESTEAIESYARWLAEQYRGIVRYFQIANEPYSFRTVNGERFSGADYVRFLEAAYRGIKAGNPDAAVLGFASNFIHDGINSSNNGQRQFFLSGMNTMRGNGKFSFDVYSAHPYHARAPELRDQWVKGLCWITQGHILLDYMAYFDIEHKGRAATEIGYTMLVPEYRSARYIVRMFAWNEVFDFYDRMFIYQLQNQGYGWRADGRIVEYHFGLLRHKYAPDWRRQNAYAAKPAYLTMAWWNHLMAGAEFIHIDSETTGIFINNHNDTTNKVSRADFVNNGTNISVVWDIRDSNTPIEINANGAATIVYDMFGNIIQQIEGVDIITVYANSAPVYVVSYFYSNNDDSNDDGDN